MSLRLDDVGPLLGATCAADVARDEAKPSKTVVGFCSGDLRIYDGNTLEREVRIGKSVTSLAHVPHSDLVAAVCDLHCSVHNLATRRVVCEVNSRSAKFLAASPGPQNTGILVVGSSYKLRILHFLRDQLVKSSVVDTPGIQKVRCIGRIDEDGVFVLLGNRPVVLWRLDLAALVWKPFLALDASVFRNGAHRFVLSGTTHSLFIGCSSGAQLIRLDPLKFVKSWHEEFFATAILTSTPLNLPLIAAQSSRLLLINPATASILDEMTDVQLVGNFGICKSKLVRVQAQLSIDQITNLPNPSEAASLAFILSPDCITEELRSIERSEAAYLFKTGDVDEAMRLFLQVEEQDDTLTTHPFVTSLLKPYLDGLALPDYRSRKPEMVPSSQNSVFSAKTSRSAPKHFLDPVVAYLVFTRRKLRIANFEGSNTLDTALLRCYIIMGSALVVPLLRSANKCDPEVVRELLFTTGKWRELVWFLRSRENHKEALDLLVEHKDPSESIIAYLESLPASSNNRLDLMFEYAKSLLVQNHSLAKQLFFEEHDVDSAKVFSYLSDIDSNLGQSFAEFRVMQFGDKNSALLNAIVRCWAKKPEKQTQLLQFIADFKTIDAKELITDSTIPKRGIAILHERLGQHAKAVETLLTECDDLDAALKVAERNNIVTFLFEKLMQSSSSPLGLTDLLYFLNKASPLADLELGITLMSLPNTIKVASTAQFLRTFIANCISKEKSSAIAEAVNRLALTELTVQITEHRKQKFSVTSTDACSVCHKRLGKAVTGVVEGNPVHYACLKLL